jgi:PTH1 family peptidyl-tRNA hydrolase
MFPPPDMKCDKIIPDRLPLVCGPSRHLREVRCQSSFCKTMGLFLGRPGGRASWAGCLSGKPGRALRGCGTTRGSRGPTGCGATRHADPTTALQGALRRNDPRRRAGVVIKPQTFMNLSGEAVRDAAAFYRIHPGRFPRGRGRRGAPGEGKLRFRRAGAPGGHKGSSASSFSSPPIRSAHQVGVGAPPHPDTSCRLGAGGFRGAEKRAGDAATPARRTMWMGHPGGAEARRCSNTKLSQLTTIAGLSEGWDGKRENAAARNGDSRRRDLPLSGSTAFGWGWGFSIPAIARCLRQ